MPGKIHGKLISMHFLLSRFSYFVWCVCVRADLHKMHHFIRTKTNIGPVAGTVACCGKRRAVPLLIAGKTSKSGLAKLKLRTEGKKWKMNPSHHRQLDVIMEVDNDESELWVLFLVSVTTWLTHQRPAANSGFHTTLPTNCVITVKNSRSLFCSMPNPRRRGF